MCTSGQKVVKENLEDAHLVVVVYVTSRLDSILELLIGPDHYTLPTSHSLEGLATELINKNKKYKNDMLILQRARRGDSRGLDRGPLESEASRPERHPSHLGDHRWEGHGIEDRLSQHPQRPHV